MAATDTAGLRPDIVFAGDGVLYVYFPDRIDRAVNQQVIALFHRLRAQAVAGIAELVPGYRSLMIAFDPLALTDEQLVTAVQRALAAADRSTSAQKLVTIPVVYGGDYGPDLPVVARYSGLAPDEVVRLHSAAFYDVFCVGFTPGFPFLGGLPPQLATPRRAQPRLRVEAGSVAIAGAQAGIYPLPSPGGWQIIGRTPLALCDLRPDAPVPFLLQPGDRVRFEAVDEEAFVRLAAQEHPGVADGA